MFTKIFNPGVFHGGKADQLFFEGWYYKMISADQQQRWAIIPGVFHHPDPAQRHAFIQVLNGVTSEVHYHRFPVESFQGSKTDMLIKIAGNTFTRKGLNLNLENGGQRLVGELGFEELKPWPISLLSPGVMGPYRYAPFMQTYHGVISLDHTIEGSLRVDGERVDFSRGRGYMEKDWGRTFPRAYIWMQSNHFSDQGVSLTASVATIPWLTSWFRGYLVGLLVGEDLYRFTTYLGSAISTLSVDDSHVRWQLVGGRATGPGPRYAGYSLSIQAERSAGGLLSSPELDGMTPRILESLTGVVDIELKGNPAGREAGEVIYAGRGTCGGLEIAGSIEEIVDQPGEG